LRCRGWGLRKTLTLECMSEEARMEQRRRAPATLLCRHCPPNTPSGRNPALRVQAAPNDAWAACSSTVATTIVTPAARERKPLVQSSHHHHSPTNPPPTGPSSAVSIVPRPTPSSAIRDDLRHMCFRAAMRPNQGRNSAGSCYKLSAVAQSERVMATALAD
jgi:hypothetical protein